MVSAGHYLASAAANRILEAGGNAADAGVAGGVCLNVVQPDLTSIGGVAPVAYFDSGTTEVSTVSGLGPWPKEVDLDWLAVEGRIPPGVRRSVVPSAMGAWLTTLEHFGSMSLSDVLAPAIELAAEGFRVTNIMHDTFADPGALAGLRRWESNTEIYLTEYGEAPPMGAPIIQSDLARTLEKLVEASVGSESREEGIVAARDRFYKGDIAAAMVSFVRDQGGWLSMEDLEEFAAEVEPALSTEYRGNRVYGCNAWCQGPAVLQTLNILEGFDMANIAQGSANYYHLILESLKSVFADRERYYGDPRFVDVPIDGLLNKDYAAERRAQINHGSATPGMPEPGDAWAYSTKEPSGDWTAPKARPGRIEPDTSYLCVVDQWGNAFSATPSDGASGTPVVPGLGFIVSSRGVQSWIDPSHPSSIRPGKRPRLTPNPGMVVKDGEFVMPYGTPGADVQPQAMIQFLVGHLDHGLDIQQAMETPRAATYSFPGTHDPHAYNPGLVRIEARAGDRTMNELANRGHRIEAWPEWTGVAGSLSAIRASAEDYQGAADPRRVAYAFGW